MKKHKKLFDEICSFQNLYLAYLKARKAKRYKFYVLKFDFYLEENLLNLQKDLLSLTYQPKPYRQFTVCDSKKRLIKAPAFSDRIIHHALCNIIDPIFDKSFIFDSYACRKNKGTRKAVKRLEKFIKSSQTHLRENKSNARIYCLKCDISKYFENINHDFLFNFVSKKIKDKKTLWLVRRIIESNPQGVPIGNLTSQLFANIYLNELDKFIKHCLKIKYYLRYMDDFLILENDKQKLNQAKEQIGVFLKEKLKLELNPKKVRIFPIEQGIDFLGYRVFDTYRILRKNTVKRFIKRTKYYQKKSNKGLLSFEKLDHTLQSWLNYARWGNSWRLRRNLEEKLRVKFET